MTTFVPLHPTSFKARYVSLKAYKKTEYVDLCFLLSICNNIHIKLLGTQFLGILDYYALHTHSK